MKKLLSVALLALALSFSTVAAADEGSTLRVVSVETNDVAAYVDQLQKGKKLIQAVDENFIINAWQATFAGDDAGTVVVSVIYPGAFSNFAAAWEKLMANPEVAAWLAGLSGLRTIVSDSVYRELPL